MDSPVDVAVIGSGFGGMGAALSLAEQGLRVCLLETLNYPGGCASTFTKNGYRFDAGATLSSGFAPEQLFGRWMQRYSIPLELEWIDPIVRFRSQDLCLDIPANREQLLERLSSLEGAPRKNLERFFTHQGHVANVLWGVLDEPSLLPPFTAKALLEHLGRTPRYLPLVRDIGRSLEHVLKRYGLLEFHPLRHYLDALSQITVQCGVKEAEAPFALSIMDYYFRGTAHVRGGMGALAHGLCDAIGQAGSVVRFSSRVKRLQPNSGGGWIVESSRGQVKARCVVANLLPVGVQALLPPEIELAPWANEVQAKVETGWGAVMLYAVAHCTDRGKAEHWQLIDSPSEPLHSGNHVFCSVSGDEEAEYRGESEHRTLTLSTHIPLQALRSLSQDEQVLCIEEIQNRMQETFRKRAKDWAAKVILQFSASPRTFERFTARPQGFVGGIPKRAGLGNYRRLSPQPVAPNLFLVGDSVFPGQSTLATATGGCRLAAKIVSDWK